MYRVAVQNKFEFLGKAEMMDQQWVKFYVAVTEAAVEQIPRVERKTKQKYILGWLVKRRQVKIKEIKYEILHKEIRKN